MMALLQNAALSFYDFPLIARQLKTLDHLYRNLFVRRFLSSLENVGKLAATYSLEQHKVVLERVLFEISQLP